MGNTYVLGTDRLVDRCIELTWAEFISSEKLSGSSGAQAPVSPGFIHIRVNEDDAKRQHYHFVGQGDLVYAAMVHGEGLRVGAFQNHIANVGDKYVLLESLADAGVGKLVKVSEASRYFSGGRRRMKAKIYKRLGKWFNCPGFLLSLTFAPELITREEAWRTCRERAREFMNRINRWRRRAGMPRAKFFSVLEVQLGTGYPHVHLVFPYLRWLAPAEFMTATWGQEANSVDWKVKDSFSPVGYVCKYITKLDGWSDLALSYIWTNKTRLYSMSRDYVLPDYSDKRVPEWRFRSCLRKSKALVLLKSGLAGYDTLLGADDLVREMIGGLGP